MSAADLVPRASEKTLGARHREIFIEYTKDDDIISPEVAISYDLETPRVSSRPGESPLAHEAKKCL